MIADLFRRLQKADFDPTTDEIADAMWLCRHLPANLLVGSEDSNAEPQPAQIDTRRRREPAPILADDIGAAEQLTAWAPQTAVELAEERAPADDPIVILHRDLDRVDGSRRAIGFRVPGVAALPEARDLGLAMRPLSRPLGRSRTLILNEEETVRRLFEDKILAPALVPDRGRWANLVLVVDTSPTMAIWDQTVKELRRLFERQGGFRDVRTWRLDPSTTPISLRPSLRSNEAISARSLRELHDPAGHRMIVVVSDCVHKAWSDGAVAEALEYWATRGSVAVLHVFPPRLWPRSAVGLPTRHLSATSLVVSNISLRLDPPQPRAEPRALPLPILSLDRVSFSNWAKIVAGQVSIAVAGIDIAQLRPSPPVSTGAASQDEDDWDAESAEAWVNMT
ncbi:MAG: hypothetical protein H0W86_13620 [Armatimonadetes bacterium]|nr:hypothetical protein [Armatimonadota bacterium]